MKNLIPHFIHDNFKAGNEQGQFDAVTMFMDIAGFTPLTEALMQHGKEGAEILNDILNAIFEPVVEAIYRRDGFVTGFAGDALTAVFIIDENLLQGFEPYRRLGLNALYAAKAINTIFAENSRQATKFGEFEISVKIGLSSGTVQWGIVGSDQHKAWYFRGQAIDRCALAEHFCNPQEIIIDNVLGSRLPETITFQELVSNFMKLIGINQPEGKRPRIKSPRITPKVARHFLPETIISFEQSGEFRNIASVFLSFQEPASDENLDILAKNIIELTDLYGGYLEGLDFGDKGGNCLVIFGAPVSYEDSIIRALNFIHSLQAEIGGQIRAGVTYGTVFAGIKGSRHRAVYGVLGDVVNLAARLMMKADWGRVLAAPSIIAAARQNYQFEAMGQIQLKGKSQKTTIYRLSSEIETQEHVFKGPFVGRSVEMAEATRIFQPLTQSQCGGVFYIYGEAGVGKSRLIHELKQKHPEFNWLYLPCDEILKKSFNPIRYFLDRFFEQSHQADQAINQAAFERTYISLLTTLEHSSAKNGEMADISAELKRLMPIVAGFLGIRYENSLYDQLDAKGRYENTLYAFKEIVKALSLSSPTVTELEDLHWIDSDTKAAFKTLLTNIADYPIAVITSSRYLDDGTKPTLIDHEDAKSDIHKIDLNTLCEAGIKEVAEDYLNGTISENLLNHLTRKTEGNPFFIEQTVRYYQENKIVAIQADAWELQKTDSDLPQSINDLIMARIDRLSQRLKQTIQTAAIVGYEFDAEVLQGVLNRIDKSWLTDGFSNLLCEIERSNIWQTITEMHYVFSHALIRDAVYQMQLRTHLRQVHQISAEYLEEKYPDNPQVYGELAHHYEQADNRDKTIEYLEKAGDDAKANYRNEEALGYYDRLINLIDSKENVMSSAIIKKRILITLEQNSIYSLRGEFSLCKKLLYQTLYRAQKHNDKNLICCTLGDLAIYYWNICDYNNAIKFLSEKLAIATEINNKVHISHSYGVLGIVYCIKGDLDQAFEYLKKQLILSKELERKEDIADAIGNMGNIFFNRGEINKAKKNYYKQLEIAQELNDVKVISTVSGNLGAVFWYQGDFDKSLHFYEKQLAIAKSIGDKTGVIKVLGNMGELYISLGNYNMAMSNINRSLEMSTEINYRNGMATAFSFLGEIYFLKGDHENALMCFLNEFKLLKLLGDNVKLAIVFKEIGLVRLVNGDYTKALLWFNRAIMLQKYLGCNINYCKYLLFKAETLFSLQRFSEAYRLNSECQSVAQKIKQTETIFSGNILSTKINFWGFHKTASFTELEQMLSNVTDDEQIAEINHELQKMYDHLGQKEKAEQARQTALDIYQKLYQKTPKYEYKKRIEELQQAEN